SGVDAGSNGGSGGGIAVSSENMVILQRSSFLLRHFAAERPLTACFPNRLEVPTIGSLSSRVFVYASLGFSGSFRRLGVTIGRAG
ncbi:MAG: hypothetical protein ACK56I_00145, partial [bacterium]